MLLKQKTKSSVDLSTEIELVTYTNDSNEPRSITSRVKLGGAQRPIGGGLYFVRLYVDDIQVLPDTPLNIIHNAPYIAQSRLVTLAEGETLSVRAKGLVDDTDIPTSVILIDVTTPTIESILQAVADADWVIDGESLDAAIRAGMNGLEVHPERVTMRSCSSKNRVVLGPCQSGDNVEISRTGDRQVISVRRA